MHYGPNELPRVPGAGPRRFAPAMERVFLVVAVGGMAAAGAYIMSRVGQGLLEGAGFLLAIFIATVTVGLALSQGAVVWQDRREHPITGPSAHRAGGLPIAAGMICGCCGRSMEPFGSVWLCRVCDRAPVDC